MKAQIEGRDGRRGELEIRALGIGEILKSPHRKVVGGCEYTTMTRMDTYWTNNPRPDGEILGEAQNGMLRVRGPWEDRIYNLMCKGKVKVTGPVPGIENLAYALGQCDSCEFQVVEELYRVA